MQEIVIIDCLPESIQQYRKGYAVVVVDVIRATTTAVTVVATGGRCFPVHSIEAALQLAPKLDRPLLAGELAGIMPEGFDLNNSPAELALRRDVSRPVILLSSSGTRLMQDAGHCEAAYVACFRNFTAVARYLVGRHPKVAIIGAGSRGEFREEDQMCCAWIAQDLIKAGYKPEDGKTEKIVQRWMGAPPSACATGKSAEYLRRSGQLQDLDFVLTHINDLHTPFVIERGEVVMLPSGVETLQCEGEQLGIAPAMTSHRGAFLA